MLGIRKYLGASIDLWQGEASQFVCDVLVVPQDPHDPAAYLSLVVSSLDDADKDGSRHVTIAVMPNILEALSPNIAAEKGILSARTFLDERKKRQDAGLPVRSSVRRITFALTDGATYELFQNALFREFPEELL